MWHALAEIMLPVLAAVVAVIVCGWNKPPRELDEEER